ncbi:MAG: DUF86 domain-containing protein [Deltaproteobacteria bacterium]|nr:DUF86 domain-containing protein [Deltaproteobacteria bacterium]
MEFVCDEKGFDAVMRELEITGEAIKHLLDSEEVRHLAKPEWRIIVDFRNVIVHEYFGIDADEVFKVVKDNINTLEEEIMELIAGITDKARLYDALDCAIEDLYKMNRKESIDYLKSICEKLSLQ